MKKKLLKMKKEKLRDLWEYHGDILKSIGIKKSGLEDGLDGIGFQDWEDVAWFVGYISALDDFNYWLNK